MKPVGQKPVTEATEATKIRKPRTSRSQSEIVLEASGKVVNVLQRAWMKADRDKRERIQGALEKMEALDKELAAVFEV